MQRLPAGPEACPGWDKVVRLTVEACVHNSEGREGLAVGIVQSSLPAAIQSWSNASEFSADDCKESLRTMFKRVRQQVETAAIRRRVALERAPESGRFGLRRRIPIDDIPGMLDALGDAGFALSL